MKRFRQLLVALGLCLAVLQSFAPLVAAQTPPPSPQGVPPPKQPGNAVIFNAVPCPSGSYQVVQSDVDSATCWIYGDPDLYEVKDYVNNTCGAAPVGFASSPYVVYNLPGRGVVCAFFADGKVEDLTSSTGGGGGSGKQRVSPECKPSSDPESGNSELTSENCSFIKWLVILTNVLSASVATVVVIMIIVGGIQYASSADDPQKVQAAKKKIFNALFALVAFIFTYAFLDWIIPGGLF